MVDDGDHGFGNRLRIGADERKTVKIKKRQGGEPSGSLVSRREGLGSGDPEEQGGGEDGGVVLAEGPFVAGFRERPIEQAPLAD